MKRLALILISVVILVSLMCDRCPGGRVVTVQDTGQENVKCDGHFETDVVVTNQTGRTRTFDFNILNVTNIDQGMQTFPNSASIQDGDNAYVKVRGKLTNPCLNGTFTLKAKATEGINEGEGNVTVTASVCDATAPAGVTPRMDGRFSYTVNASCCAGAAAGAYNVTFGTPQNVTNLTANPNRFNCPGPATAITVRGKLVELTREGRVLVEITAPGGAKCALVTLVEPAR